MNHYVKVLQDEFHPKEQEKYTPRSTLAIFISQNKGRTKAAPWTHEPWKHLQSQIQSVQDEADAERYDAQSLSCEGKHNDQDEVE